MAVLDVNVSNVSRQAVDPGLPVAQGTPVVDVEDSKAKTGEEIGHVKVAGKSVFRRVVRMK